jgi:putative spermidine/putrescine transport system permease protein
LVVVVAGSFSASSSQTWPPQGFSLRWYEKVLNYAPFRDSLLYSVTIAVIATAVTLVLGLLASYAIARYNFPGRKVLQGLFIAPLSVPRIVIGFSLFVLYATLVPSFYGSVASVAVAHCVLLLPFVVSIIGASLSGTDPMLEEASRDLGRGPVSTFLRVTLPQLRTGIITAAVFAFVTSFDEVDTSIFLVPSDQSTLPIQMFLYVEQAQDPTLAALSTLLILFSVVILVGTALMVGMNGLIKSVTARSR